MKFFNEDFEDDSFLNSDNPITDDEFIEDPTIDDEFADDYSMEDEFTDEPIIDDEKAEIEMVLAEPSKLVDADGSVVLVGAGDVVTIQSESLKRIKHSGKKV
mgnify:CR=1 FL=1